MQTLDFKRGCRWSACLLALALVTAITATAQPIIKPGIDLLQTLSATGTTVSFASNPIPPGFFCSDSAAFTGSISFHGQPLATDPPGIAGTSDTIVERLHEADLSSGMATVPVVVRAMNLFGDGVVQIQCAGGLTRWVVNACTCDPQPITQIKINLDDPGCGCGRFTGDLIVNVCLTFTNIDTGEVRGPIQQKVPLAIEGMPWCEKGGPGSLAVSQPFLVDTTCNGDPNLALPCTSNFAPGWFCGAPDCWTIFADLTTCHKNPNPDDDHDHCINPVCGKRQ
jgi:hypothetical protein